MMSVSGCCLKPIEAGQKKSYAFSAIIPTYFKVDYCAGCGKEVEEPVLVFDCCGLETCECESSVSVER